jgi:hypothetical protein
MRVLAGIVALVGTRVLDVALEGMRVLDAALEDILLLVQEPEAYLVVVLDQFFLFFLHIFQCY